VIEQPDRPWCLSYLVAWVTTRDRRDGATDVLTRPALGADQMTRRRRHDALFGDPPGKNDNVRRRRSGHVFGGGGDDKLAAAAGWRRHVVTARDGQDSLVGNRQPTTADRLVRQLQRFVTPGPAESARRRSSIAQPGHRSSSCWTSDTADAHGRPRTRGPGGSIRRSPSNAGPGTH